ncbi:MAG TPA: 50S ribosomal protein L20 [Planctomycetota bacterium]|nr:50S ribosomal protein L20 [Planctomycetota bacterium]MDP7246050.1 50S ribosomal protein L20 [Planctomycetota bacterium]HJM39154.1 50S ribosomal protein L20 [Planctomycetota bacterium]
MTRARNVVPRLRRRRRLMRRAKGNWGARRKLVRTVKETLLRSGMFAFRDRRNRKRVFRRLWIQRLNAAARSNGLSYSKLIHGMGKAGMDIDRKALSELAFHDPAAFSVVVERAKESLAA